MNFFGTLTYGRVAIMLNFLGIGAQKAGTTWLYTQLSRHPDIHFPLAKEAHYWNKKFPQRSVTEYLSNFRHKNKCEGEITPAYSHLPSETIAAIYNELPQLKIIYILRNPIDRAWSSAQMALARAEMEFDEASDAWFIDHFNSKGSRMRGSYEHCLKNWYNTFGHAAVLVLFYEDIQSRPERILDLCCQHLSVDTFSEEDLRKMPLRKKIFAGKQHILRPALRQHLVNLYAGEIRSLSEYLQVDLEHWL